MRDGSSAVQKRFDADRDKEDKQKQEEREEEKMRT